MPRLAAPSAPRVRWVRLLVHLGLLTLFAVIVLPAVAVGTVGRHVVESAAYAPSAYAPLRFVAATPLPLPFTPADSAVDVATAGRLYRQTFGLRSDDVPGATPRQGDPLPLPTIDGVPDGLFEEGRTRLAPQPSRDAMVAALTRGLTRAEREYVARVAADPVWRLWDSLATAPRLDVMDAAFELPFAPSVAPQLLPVAEAARVRALIDATALRAVHLASVGQREAAVRAIGSTATVGRLLTREGPLALDALIGLRLMTTAAQTLSALERAAPVAGSAARAAALDTALALVARQRELVTAGPSTGRDLAADALRTVRDPAAPRAQWMEAATVLAFAPCNSPSTALVRSDLARSEAFAQALARGRYASDSLVIAQARDLLRHPPREIQSDGVQRVLRTLARGGSFITRNPTVESCLIYLDAAF